MSEDKDNIKKVKAKATPKPKKPKKKKNYINNADMMDELRKSHEQDQMTDKLANMVMLLAERYSRRYEYVEYSPHIEDMRAIAVMNVVRAWRKFDMDNYDNPFAYFTQAITHTFWQYSSQEKKHRLNRDHMLINLGEMPSDKFMEDYNIQMESEKIERELKKRIKELDSIISSGFEDDVNVIKQLKIERRIKRIDLVINSGNANDEELQDLMQEQEALLLQQENNQEE